MFQTLAVTKPIIIVLDKGFFSAENVNAMLSVKLYADFIVAVQFTCNFVNDFVKNEGLDIDRFSNTIVNGKDSLRGVTRTYKWDKKHDVYAHIYYNARKAMGVREDLYAHVATLRDQAMSQPEKYVGKADYKKYLIIRRSKTTSSGYTVNVREDVIEDELKNAGWLVLISNCIQDAKEAIKIYRDKDIVEKGFLRLKNSLDLGRLRVHSENSMQNKVFVGFISLILLSAIHKSMLDKDLYKKMTMKKLLLILAKLKMQMVKGVRILFPLTKVQRSIFEAIGVPLPV